MYSPYWYNNKRAQMWGAWDRFVCRRIDHAWSTAAWTISGFDPIHYQYCTRCGLFNNTRGGHNA